MKKILVLLFICSTLYSQQISKWQNFTNLQDINDIESTNNDIWAATNGGVFGYSKIEDSYHILTKSDGLSSHSITTIAIDQSGKIWIGTSEGYIDVYDPSTGLVRTILQIFKEDNSNKRINDIEIQNDTVYVAFAFGLSLINANDLTFIESARKFGKFGSETPVSNILIDQNIYVNTQSGIAIKKASANNLAAPESWQSLALDSIAQFNTINDIAIYNNLLHAATNDGIFSYSNGSWSQIIYDNLNVKDLVVVNNSLYSVIRNSVRKFDQIDEILINIPNTSFNIIQVENDNLFIGTNKGVLDFSVERTETILPNSPKTNSIQSMTVDFEGNLWVGTGRDGNGIGVLKYNGIEWKIIDRDTIPTFRTNDFHKVSSSSDAVYLISWGSGYTKYQNESFSNFDASNTDIIGIPGSNSFVVISDVKEDLSGNAWILNYWAADRKPISVLTREGQFYSYQFSSPLFPSIINTKNLVVDQFGTKWFSGDFSGDVATDGLYYFNENGTFENISDDDWGKINESNGLRNRDVLALALDQFGELIIGTSEGVDVIPNTSSPNSIRGDQYFALRQQSINAIAVDPINQKWFGTEKGVFLTSSDGSTLLANYTKDNSPLPSDNIISLAIDEKNGIVYVGTDFGITAISTLFIEPNKNFSDLYVYPNPITLSNNNSSNIVIDGLIEDSKITILDISGNLISEFRSIGGKTTTWNCRDLKGKLISSGIYIVVAFDEEVNEIGHAKFAVLRK